jgi:hypothetical protein
MWAATVVRLSTNANISAPRCVVYMSFADDADKLRWVNVTRRFPDGVGVSSVTYRLSRPKSHWNIGASGMPLVRRRAVASHISICQCDRRDPSTANR